MIVDGQVFIGESIFGHVVRAQDVISLMDELEIDRAVVCPFKPRSYRLESANDVVAQAVADYPQRFVGLARVDPRLRDDAVAEAERGFDDLGLQGLFLHPWEETFVINSALVDPVVGVAVRRERPVLIASGYPWLSEGLQVGDLAARFPRTTFIATNGGQINISGLGQTDVRLALRANPNLVVQSAGVYREDFLHLVVSEFGSSRLVFASGFPQYDLRLEILRIRWAGFQPDSETSILGGTLATIFPA